MDLPTPTVSGAWNEAECAREDSGSGAKRATGEFSRAGLREAECAREDSNPQPSDPKSDALSS